MVSDTARICKYCWEWIGIEIKWKKDTEDNTTQKTKNSISDIWSFARIIIIIWILFWIYRNWKYDNYKVEDIDHDDISLEENSINREEQWFPSEFLNTPINPDVHRNNTDVVNTKSKRQECIASVQESFEIQKEYLKEKEFDKEKAMNDFKKKYGNYLNKNRDKDLKNIESIVEMTLVLLDFYWESYVSDEVEKIAIDTCEELLD